MRKIFSSRSESKPIPQAFLNKTSIPSIVLQKDVDYNGLTNKQFSTINDIDNNQLNRSKKKIEQFYIF